MGEPEAPVIKTTTVTLTALCVLQLAADTPLAQDSPAVGSLVAERRGGGSWLSKQEASRSIGTGADSLWMWNVEPNPNLATSLDERGGPALEAEESPFDFIIRDLEAGASSMAMARRPPARMMRYHFR